MGMWTVRLVGAAVLVWATPGCLDLEWDDSGDVGEYGETSQEIVRGMEHRGDPAVVALNLGGQGICTGTLISPQVVLTAAHCLVVPANQIVASFVSQVGEPGPAILASAFGSPPGSDIAAITLSRPAEALPTPYNKRALEDDVGAPVRLVGFGSTGEDAEDAGLKRWGWAELTRVAPNADVSAGEMATTNDLQGTCYGDSGGPNFISYQGVEYVAGVTSRGTAACGAGLDIAVRTDSHHGWLAAYIQSEDPANCGSDGRCSLECATMDPDCCVSDGFCNAICGLADPECPADQVSFPGPPNSGGGGCAVASTERAFDLWPLLAALLLLLRRRNA